MTSQAEPLLQALVPLAFPLTWQGMSRRSMHLPAPAAVLRPHLPLHTLKLVQQHWIRLLGAHCRLHLRRRGSWRHGRHLWGLLLGLLLLLLAGSLCQHLQELGGEASCRVFVKQSWSEGRRGRAALPARWGAV